MDTPNNVQENTNREKAFAKLRDSTDLKIESDEDFFTAVEAIASDIAVLEELTIESDKTFTFNDSTRVSLKTLVKGARKELDDIVTLYHS